MKTSRQHLLEFLRKKQVASVKEISFALKMTPANARHHLSILIDQGSVEKVGKIVGQGPGRPSALYKATRSPSKNNLSDLTCGILFELLRGISNIERDNRLRNIARYLIREDIQNTNHPYKRLNDTIQRLIKMNYHARWEAHFEAPHIILESCPYLEIVVDFPEICRLDKYVLEALLGNQVTQLSKLESTKTGFQRCVFIMESEF